MHYLMLFFAEVCPHGQSWHIPVGWTKHGPDVYLNFEQDNCLELITGTKEINPGMSNVRQSIFIIFKYN